MSGLSATRRHEINARMATAMLVIGIVLIFFSSHLPEAAAFAVPGKGFGKGSSSNSNGDPSSSFASFDRFRSTCPADIGAIKQFDPSLISYPSENVGCGEKRENDDIWVAVYRSKNNLPSVFVRDAFFDAMALSTTVQEGDSETLVSLKSQSPSSSSTIVGSDVASSGNFVETKPLRPVAVARLSFSSSSNISIIDSMRCTLKKEDTNADCDGGSEHAEAIGICIDELVLSYLQQYHDDPSRQMHFDGGVRFRGTLVSGKLLEARGFREVNELTSDMHSHETDFDGALERYAERSTSKEVAKNPGARNRALQIVSYLAKIDREEDKSRARQEDEVSDPNKDDDDHSDFDPWASVKKYI